MRNILVTGAQGQVGQEFQALAKNYPNFQFQFVGREILDITNQTAVADFFNKNKFHYCVNCAAYTAVDKAESQIEIAEKVNVLGVQYLALACAKQEIPFIQLSSDYVYHNTQNLPFKESDLTNPQGVYARTKLEGDEIALSSNPITMVMRTSWVYSSFGNNFVKTMLRLGRERMNLSVIFDQIGTPTYAKDIAIAILEILQKVEKGTVQQSDLKGIFHFSNEGVCSWYDFAKAIFEIKKIECHLTPIETVDYPTPAKRPPFSVLNKRKIKAAFGIEIPYWRDSLKDCLEYV